MSRRHAAKALQVLLLRFILGARADYTYSTTHGRHAWHQATGSAASRYRRSLRHTTPPAPTYHTLQHFSRVIAYERAIRRGLHF